LLKQEVVKYFVHEQKKNILPFKSLEYTLATFAPFPYLR